MSYKVKLGGDEVRCDLIKAILCPEKFTSKGYFPGELEYGSTSQKLSYPVTTNVDGDVLIIINPLQIAN